MDIVRSKKVCLVNTPSLFKRPLSRSMAGGLGFDGSQSMTLPPLDLAMLASQLRANHYEVFIIDADPLQLDDPAVLSLVREGKYSAVVAAVSLPTLYNDCSFIAQLRGLTDKVIIKTMIRDNAILHEVLKISGADFVIHCECDMHIHDLIDGTSVAGTAFIKEGKLVVEDVKPVEDMDKLPLPSWDLLPLDKYTYPLLGQGVMTMQTSRGCPFPCSYYCPYPLVEGNVWRGQSPERVVKEIEELVIKYGVRKILFRDATFTFNKERIHNICDLIIDRHLQVTWWCETRVDRLDENLLEKMKQAGCAGINIGVETGDRKVMARQAKRGLTIEKLTHLRTFAKALGIKLHFLISKGFPDETRKSFVDTYELLMKLRPDSLGITIMTPYPGTQLYKDAEAKGWIESKAWEDYGGHQFVMHTDNLSRDDLYYGLNFLKMQNVLIQKSNSGADPYEIRKTEKELYTELLIWAAGLADLREKLSVRQACRTEAPVLHERDNEQRHINNKFKLSIIIPTYNRREQLVQCLNKLSEQRIDSSQFEVIVIDDGSTDGTENVLSDLKLPYKFRYARQSNSGPGTARNLGVNMAENEIVAFIGDDIMASPDFVSEHLTAHKENPDPKVAVLGLIEWPPELEINPLMKCITGPNGLQFNFSEIKNKQDVGYYHFYTSNISLKKSFLREMDYLFDADFIYAACEDIELGYRMSKKGLRIIYHPEALVYHFHPMDLESFMKREAKVGEMLVVMGKKHPVNHDIRTIQHETLEYQSRCNGILKSAKEMEYYYETRLKNLKVNGVDLGENFLQGVLFPVYQYILRQSRNSGVLKGRMEKQLDPSVGSEVAAAKVSIIVPIFNKVEYTQQCLEALSANTSYQNFEVIIIDNGSTDGTREFLKCLEGDLKVISNENNAGFAKACNQGARAAEGEYLVFLNNDTVPQEGWLENLVNTARERRDVAIVGSKLLFPDGRVQHAGVVFEVNAAGCCVYHIYRGIDKDHPAVNHMREFNAVTAACMLIRRDTFFDAGMFDEDFINGYEDVDLCLKVREKGGKIVYNPASVLIHHEGVTDGRIGNTENNNSHFLKRWMGKIKSDAQLVAAEDGIRIEYQRDSRVQYHYDQKQKPELECRRVVHPEQKGFKKKVAIIRGSDINKWEMQNYEPLKNMYDLTAYAAAHTRYDTSGLDIPIVRLPSPSSGISTYLEGLEDRLSETDLIFSADISYMFSAQSVIAKKKYGSKLICLEWENIPFNFNDNKEVRRVKEIVLEGADHFIAVTNRAKEALVLEGVPEEKIDVVFMGIDLNKFRPSREESVKVREQLGMDGNELIILFIGRMVWEKGVYDFVHAAANIHKDKALSELPLRFLMVGQGPELENIRERVSSLDMSNKFSFVEEFPYGDMCMLHNTADIFVLPSISVKAWQEQFGMVLIESMACGKPVISTLSGSIPEVVAEAGILVQPNDHLSLYSAMKKLILDKSLREKIGKMALERAGREFDSAKTSQKIRRVFERVLSNERAEALKEKVS